MKPKKISSFKILCALFLAFLFVGVQDANAQFWKKKKKAASKTAVIAKKKSPKKKAKTIKELTESSKKIEGLFTIFQDTVTGATKLLIKEDLHLENLKS